jgi:hypothetical protein
VLFDKGYYLPEAWLTPQPADETVVQSTSDRELLEQRVEKNPALGEYYWQVRKLLGETLVAAGCVHSDFVAPAATATDTAVKLSSELILAAAHLLPGSGLISAGIKAARVVHETKSQYHKKVDAVLLSNWKYSHAEVDNLAEALASQLTLWQQLPLVLTKPSWLPYAKECYRKLRNSFKEGGQLTVPQQLAMYDVVTIIALMKEIKPVQDHSLNASNRVSKNTSLLYEAFRQLNPEKLSSTTHSIQSVDSSQASTSLPPSAITYWRQPQQRMQLQTASTQQLIQDEEPLLEKVLREQQQDCELRKVSYLEAKARESQLSEHATKLTNYIGDQLRNLDPTTNSIASPQPTADKEAENTRKEFYEATTVALNKNGLPDFKAFYIRKKGPWEIAYKQGRSSAESLRQELVANLKATQDHLNQLRQTQQLALKTAQQTLTAAEQQYRQLEEINKNLKQVANPAESEKAFLLEDKQSVSAPTWEITHDLVQQLEIQLGTPPCGFAIVAWNHQSPGSLFGEWRWAILLTETETQTHVYWQLMARLLTSQLAFLLTTKTGMQWQVQDVSDHILSNNDLIPYRHHAQLLAVSQADKAGAKALWGIYTQNIEDQLQTRLGGVPKHRQLGHEGMQRLRSLDSSLPADGADPAANLLQPLLAWCRDIASYYGLAPASPQSILAALKQHNYLHKAFIDDISTAINWAETQLQTAQTTTTHRLSTEKQADFTRHYQLTVATLAQTAATWRLVGSPPPNGFDPLRECVTSLLQPIQQADSALEPQEIQERLKQAATICAHRCNEFILEEQLKYFCTISTMRQRAEYVALLTAALPVGHQPLLDRLREAPNAEGRRLRWLDEQKKWQEETLPKLWASDSKEQAAEATHRSLNNNPLFEPTQMVHNKDDKEFSLPPQISVVRPKVIDGISNWRGCEVQTYLLNPNIAEQLFEDNRNWKPKNTETPGNHRTYPIKIDGKILFWVKIFPEQPASEFLVTQLDRRLGIWGTPDMELVKFHHNGQTTIALITAAVNAPTLKAVLTDDPQAMKKLDFAHFIRTLFRVLLTNPEDDKDNDYFVITQPDGSLRLMRIDSERSFFQAVTHEKSGIFQLQQKKTLQVKSIFYLLEQMKITWDESPAVAAAIDDFLRLRPVALVADLLHSAKDLHYGWNALFSIEEANAHLQRQEPENGISLMCIPTGLANELVTRLTAIHTALQFSRDKRFHSLPLNGLELLQVTHEKELVASYVKAHRIDTPAGSMNPISHNHSQVRHRYAQTVGHLYTKDKKGNYQTLNSNALTISRSLRLEAPIDLPMLQKIRDGLACSPKQELALFNKWKEDRRNCLYEDLRNCKASAIAEFRGLSLRPQQQLWEKFKTALQSHEMNNKQQSFLLQAMSGIAWRILELQHFKPYLITAKTLMPLLQGAGCYLLALNISGCTHIELRDKSLDALLAHNSNLRHLSARKVSLSHIELTALPHLRELDLSNSAVQTIIGEAPHLRRLQLIDCQQLHSLGNTGLLQNTAFSAPQLTQIDLTNCQRLNQFCVPKELFFTTIAPQLPQSHSIDLKAITLQMGTGWLRVPDFLIWDICKGVTKLDYSSNKKLTPAQLKQLISYLTHDHFITELNLWNNQLGDAGAQALAAALKTNTALTTLDLSYNDLGDAGAQALAAALKTNPSLATLQLGSNQLGEAGAQALAAALKTNTALTTLYLGGNQLGDAGAQALAEVLKTNTALTTLYLGGNQLGKAGAQALAAALKTNTSLITLSLYNNELGETGEQALANMLKTNTALTTLDLGGNQLGKAGAQALAEALKTNTSLTTLSLWHNQLGETGAQALAEALKTNTALTTLDLGGNQLGKAGKAAKQAIEGYLARNWELQKTAKPTNQPKDSKSSQPPLPLPDKKETKSALKTPAAEPVAPRSQFFQPSAPVDEKAQTLLSEAWAALDHAYPPSMIEHSATRQAYSAQLMEYQSGLSELSKVERDSLRQLVTTLEGEGAAAQQSVAESSSTTTLS